MKIIPAIDLMDGTVVRLYKGDPKNKTIYSDNPVEIAKKWESAGADMIHIVDLDATLGRGENIKIIEYIYSNSNCRWIEKRRKNFPSLRFCVSCCNWYNRNATKRK
jgi:phosphoribosylformimino-5-aminoimidazole carboxamide ribonucleotide (ProFAR) isomerase